MQFSCYIFRGTLSLPALFPPGMFHVEHICDYFLAFVALGFGAGLLSRRKWSVYYGTLIGGVLRFLVHYLIGVFVWGVYMPDEFFGMTMTSPWFYSLLYNGSYMLPSIILCVLVFALLYKPLKKYFTSADLLIQK